MLEAVLDTRAGSVIISAILGMGLAVMFSRACSGRNCMIVRGPNPTNIEGKIYQFGGDCYKFQHQMTKCEIDQKKKIKVDS